MYALVALGKAHDYVRVRSIGKEGSHGSWQPIHQCRVMPCLYTWQQAQAECDRLAPLVGLAVIPQFWMGAHNDVV